MNEDIIMNKNVRKHPKIYAYFKCDKVINSSDSLLGHNKDMIHSYFKQHKYLTKSEELNSEERETVQLWCSDKTCRSMDKDDITFGLKRSSEYLCKHFNSQAFVPVDECDSPVMKALYTEKFKDDFSKIVQFSNCIIPEFMKSNKFVQHAFITGVSHIAGTDLSGLHNSDTCTFLNHSFVEFYGLTKGKVMNVLNKYKKK
jgi:hypothetical protein